MFIGKLAGKPSPKPPHFSDFVSAFFYFYLEDKEYAKKNKTKKKNKRKQKKETTCKFDSFNNNKLSELAN